MDPVLRLRWIVVKTHKRGPNICCCRIHTGEVLHFKVYMEIVISPCHIQSATVLCDYHYFARKLLAPKTLHIMRFCPSAYLNISATSQSFLWWAGDRREIFDTAVTSTRQSTLSPTLITIRKLFSGHIMVTWVVPNWSSRRCRGFAPTRVWYKRFSK